MTADRRAGHGLHVAGAIVTVVGVGIVVIQTLEMPRYWIPLFVGLGLLVAGLIRRATSRDH